MKQWILTGGELIDLNQVMNVFKRETTAIRFITCGSGAESIYIEYDNRDTRNSEFNRIKELLLAPAPATLGKGDRP